MMRLEGAVPEGAVRTTCPYCGVGCGVLAASSGTDTAVVAGDPEHPANFGRLCSKGSALGETLSLEDRMLYPTISGKRASWDEALDLVAQRFAETIAEHGPDSVAFYVSGQLLSEDYYVANKLMKGFIGSGNIDTNSRLCMSSSVAGHKRAFGADCVPGNYEDLERADLVVLAGSNLAWCHPILYQRLIASKQARKTKIVVIDPRSTATTEGADLHLAVWPGTDVALFSGLLREIVIRGATQQDYVNEFTTGFEDAVAEVESFDLDRVSIMTGIAPDQLRSFYDLFVSTERVVTVYSQGINQSTAGTDKVNSIINCHLATGRIGREGMGPFSVTGQPNAMGGREVGGLANMLACHMDIENADHRRIVGTFWKAAKVCETQGLKAVDMMRAVSDGRIKALWIMATNPVDSMPDADAVRAALEECPFVVLSDVVRDTDTSAVADVHLPSQAWGEKDGTVTNSERRISRQRAFLKPPQEVRPDWWQMAEIGKRLGFADAFFYSEPAQIFAEYAALSAYENAGTRDFDIGAFSDIGAEAYEKLEPFQWPARKGETRGNSRHFARGNFYTSDRRGRFVATPYRSPATLPTDRYPFILNTGRIRDQWHTMTRTAKTARLAAQIAEPFIEIHPDDAQQIGIAEAELAEVTSPSGRIVVRALITERQRRGSVFIPMHWTDQYAKQARVDTLVAGNTDPVSGQPELKCAAVSVRRYEAAWYGFAVSRIKPTEIDADYWAIARAKRGWRIELAGREIPADPERLARGLLAFDEAGSEVLSYSDCKGNRHRYAVFGGGTLNGAAFFDRKPVAIARNFVAESLDAPCTPTTSRFAVLAGRAGADQKDRGPTVCTCFEVGRNEIIEAVLGERCLSVDAVGVILKAGTNCGSCRPEIAKIIAEHALAKAS
jgi:assimilatory nitrate reductase catalytic subunit